MKRLIALSAFALVATVTSAPLAATSPPPPPVVVARAEPRLVFVTSSSVYVVNDRRWDYDAFRYGVYWYAYRGGYWYRARGWRGPYAALASSRVPRAIINVPAKHWKHRPNDMSPDLARKQEGVVAVERESRVHVKEKGK